MIGMKELGRAGNLLIKNKSMLRKSIEKTSIFLTGGLAVFIAIGSIMDVYTTFKKR